MSTAPFVARHVVREQSFELAAPVDAVYPYFTPAGERAWAPGWEPEFLHPAGEDLCAGMVFRTAAGGEATLWLVADHDPHAHRVRYVRVTPDSRIGFVELACATAAAGTTRVTVRYTFTALSEAGNRYLEAFDDAAFRAMMQEWRTRIGALLR